MYQSYVSENKDLKLDGKADAKLAWALIEKLKGKRKLSKKETDTIVKKYFAESAEWSKFLKFA